LAPIGEVYQAGTLSANPVAMIAGLENLKQLTPKFYAQLEKNSDAINNTLTEWVKAQGFEDYNINSFKSLFWAIPTSDQILRPDQVPSNLGDRFFSLFQILLDKGIYLSPNAYEVGFVSIAHNEEVIKDLKQRLWS
jgi:glutamate-1-semialdehyde 2,1-aminomutase